MEEPALFFARRTISLEEYRKQYEQEWLPIETAPKDGTPILFWDGRPISICEWSGVYKWQLQDAEEDGTCHPLMYMPLPPPPSLTAHPQGVAVNES